MTPGWRPGKSPYCLIARYSDSAEKPSVHPSRASGRTEEQLKSLEIFSVHGEPVEPFLGFFSRIKITIVSPDFREYHPSAARLREELRQVSGTDLRKRLMAILVADVAGYSRLMAGDELATVASLDAARSVFRTQIESHQGRVIDMGGGPVRARFAAT